MAANAPAADTKLMPKSGFGTPQFILGLLAVVGTFVLGQVGPGLNLSFLSDSVKKILTDNGGIVVGAVVAALIAGFIAVSSWIETNTVKTKGPPTKGSRPAAKIGRPFYQTSEFWLGLITVVLNYIQDSGKFPFLSNIHNSTDTTTLLIALVYTFARSQLKQAYANAQAQGT